MLAGWKAIWARRRTALPTPKEGGHEALCAPQLPHREVDLAKQHLTARELILMAQAAQRALKPQAS